MNKNLFVTILLCLTMIGSVLAQKSITGVVKSAEDDQPIPGATVREKGTSNGTVTDLDGKYTVKVAENATLVFSFVGLGSQEVVVGIQTTIDVTLKPDLRNLDEVVVTALGISREKKSLGYAVTEVSGKDVATAKELNVANSLVGKVSGLVVTQGTFGPGSSSRITIRGNNSITGNNQPLYVVDGIPIDNSGYGSASGSDKGEYSKTDYGSGVSDINPDDIASISVLKGPNAAALYGSRAANGVILITTKSGANSKGLGVTYSANYTWEKPMLLPKFQNEYGQGTEGNITTVFGDLRTIGGSWGAKLDGSSQLYYTGEKRPYSAQPDNVKDFFETGSTRINTVSLDGGNDMYNFRLSYTNTGANSILPNSTINRNNFNFRGFVKLTDKLNVDAKVTYFTQEAKNRAIMGTEGVMAYLYTIPRNVALDDLKNYQNADFSVRSYRNGSGNPYWFMNHDKNNDMRDRIQGFSKISYKINDNLSVFGRIGTDVVNQKIETVSQYGHWFHAEGRLNNTKIRTTETNIDGLVMYNKELTSDFKLAVNLGANHMYKTYESVGIFGEKFKIPTKATVESASKISPSYYPMSEKIVNSVYGSANLSYANFLYLETSMRNDWSSTLPKDNRSYFYPSVSLSGLLNEVIKVDGFDFGKLRVNWAKVGNDTEPYQLINSFNLNSASDSYLGLTILTRPNVRKDPNLKPEEVSSLEFGGEFKFLDNRIYADMSYYDIKSKNLIWDVPLPASTGYAFEHTNVGEMENKGFEMLLGFVPLRSQNLTWDISINYAKNKNTLNKLIEGIDNFEFTTTNSGAVQGMARVGGGFGDMYVTTYERDANGKVVVKADGTFQMASAKKFIGNYQPDWTGGISNTLTYKSLSLKLLIDGRFGGKVYSGTDASLDALGVTENSLKYREEGIVIDGVKADGSVNTTKISAQQYWGSYSGIAENYIFDQTNVRVREVSLTYELPKSFVNKFHVKSASFGITGRNLFFIYRALDNYDPEGSFSASNFAQGVLFYNMPTTRSFGFNLNVKF
jgi:TonB-linked SusC/RagA family outer membrane protein